MAKSKNNWKDYVSPLDIPEGSSGDWQIYHTYQEEGFETPAVHFRQAIHTGDELQMLKFPNESKWTYLAEDGAVWMSDLPCEQNQHHKMLNKMKGRILVGGLGLGFAATTLLNNPNVEAVDVIEIEPDVIKLVEPYICRDNLSLRKKLRVINQDLFQFLKVNKQGKGKESLVQYDYGFYDIWQSDGENTFFETVLPLRYHSRGLVKKVTNWNEDVMRGQLIMNLESRRMKLSGEWSVPESMKDSEEARQVFIRFDPKPDRSQIWINWSVPYMRWYFEHLDELKTMDREMRQTFERVTASDFVHSMGLSPDWFKNWLTIIESRGYPLTNTEGCQEAMDALCSGGVYVSKQEAVGPDGAGNQNVEK